MSQCSSVAERAGNLAPVLRVRANESGQWRAIRSGNRLLAFCGRWDGDGAGEALSAELRGLGAHLLVLLPRGGLYLDPDARAEALGPARHLWEAFGVRPPEQGGPALTVVFIDDSTTIRFRCELEKSGAAEEELLGVLRSASQRVRAAPARRGISRRELIATSIAAALGAVVLSRCATAPVPAEPSPAQTPSPQTAPEAGLSSVILNVNGQEKRLQIEPRVTLLDALRENLGLTGTKKGCDLGQCGACTVLVDGKRMNSCLLLAAQYEGRKITTIEGLASGDQLHPMQAAFLEHDAFQCGYCTPGQILSAVALLREGHARTDEEIRENMSGNICRCGAYPNIVAAIRAARG